MQAINQVEHGIPSLMEKYTQLQSSIEQRLKWGSGANPALNVVMENFDAAVNEKKAALMVSMLITMEYSDISMWRVYSCRSLWTNLLY